MAVFTKLQKEYEKYKRRVGATEMQRRSLTWFKNHVDQFVRRATYNQAVELGKLTTRPVVGKLYLYKYDPKWKEELPIYDTMPLVLITRKTEHGWYGINFHYMPMMARLKIMNELYKTYEGPETEFKKLKINWNKAMAIGEAVGKTEALQDSIKQYLGSHVVSPMVDVSPKHWSMIIFLPLQRFKINRAAAKMKWM